MSKHKAIGTKTKDDPLVDEIRKSVKVTKPYSLILINDDVNTFQFIIENIIFYCNHTEHQAGTCALIAHYKGECEVLRGEFADMKRVCRHLHYININAKIVPVNVFLT